MDTNPQTPVPPTTTQATTPATPTSPSGRRSPLPRLAVAGIIVMAAPAAILILLVLLYIILMSTPLAHDPNAAGIFLPGALAVGFILLLGIPIFIVGLILTIVGLNKKR